MGNITLKKVPCNVKGCKLKTKYNYCIKHECKKSCHNLALMHDYCINHACKVNKCDLGTKYNYCKKHECKKSCRCLALTDYCQFHKCGSVNCNNNRTSNAWYDIYCKYHKCRSYYMYNNRRFGYYPCNKINFKKNYCQTHICNIEGCYNIQEVYNRNTNSVYYCPIHKCSKCDEKGVKHKKCSKHLCKIQDCNNAIYNITKDDDLCDYHCEIKYRIN